MLRALVVCGCSRAVVMAAEANARDLGGLLALAGTRFFLLLYWYKGTNTDAVMIALAGTHFTCYTSTNVQILTHLLLVPALLVPKKKLTQLFALADASASPLYAAALLRRYSGSIKAPLRLY